MASRTGERVPLVQAALIGQTFGMLSGVKSPTQIHHRLNQINPAF